MARRSTRRRLKFNFDRQKDPKNKCRCAFYIANIKEVEAADELTAVFRLTDPSVNWPKILTIPSSNNVVQSPAAIQAKGDDYNRNPVGTGPFVLKSWTAGDRMVLERNPNYWNKGRPYLDRVVMRPLPDSQARFASLEAGESDLIWDDEFDSDNILKAKKNPAFTVHEYVGSGATVYAFNTKVAPFDDVRVRRALVMAIDRTKWSQVRHERPEPAGKQSLWRGLMGEVQGRRRAALRPRQGPGAAQGVRQARQVQDAGHGNATRPRQRPSPAAVLEAGRRRDGNRAGRSDRHRDAGIRAPIRLDALAHRRPRRSRSADVCQLPHGQPGRARQLLQSRARSPARPRQGDRRSREARPKTIARSAA